MAIDEQSLLTESQRINKIKAAVKKVNAERAARFIERRRELEYRNYIKTIMGDDDDNSND